MTHNTYAPLALQGTGWSITFITEPEPKVEVIGRVDDKELLRALGMVGMPIMMYYCIQAMLGGVEVKEK